MLSSHTPFVRAPNSANTGLNRWDSLSLTLELSTFRLTTMAWDDSNPVGPLPTASASRTPDSRGPLDGRPDLRCGCAIAKAPRHLVIREHGRLDY